MNAHVLRYPGSVLIRLWGLAHIEPTKSAVRGFGALPEGNRRVFTLEWAAGGMTLCFIGIRPPARHLPECGASSGPRTRECLFVGDSYETDVVGAKPTGLVTSWYNPRHRPRLGPTFART